MTILEPELEQLLKSARGTLGDAVPRLRTTKPQPCINGLTHGITGQNTFLTNAELAIYLASGAEFIKDMEPVGVREIHLAQRIIDADWRLMRIPFIEENLQKSNFIREMTRIHDEQPSLDEQTAEVCAQADAYRIVSGDIDRLSRHETRLHRLLKSMNQEYDEMQKRRGTQRGQFKLEESAAYAWYTRLSTATKGLLAAPARPMAQPPAQPPTKPKLIPIESAASEAKPVETLVCKNGPTSFPTLTEKIAESLAAAQAGGFLSENDVARVTDVS